MTDAIADPDATPDTTQDTTPDSTAERRRGVQRLAVGLAQGAVLVALIWARKQHHWPPSAGAPWAGLLFAAVFAPMVVLGGIGRLRWSVLAASALALGASAAWFGWHALDRGIGTWGDEPAQLPPATAFLLAAAFVFIGHHLVAGAEAARRWIAPHDVYFDLAWKNGVQLALSFAFTGVLWGGLALGAALFALTGVKAFGHLLQDYRVIWPITGVAFAAAVQLTDVRLGLIRGIRTVGLTLLSWLLPLMTLIAVAFLAALPITGLTSLFATRSTAALLLGAAAGLIVLINAVYQTGDVGQTPAILRWSARIAAVALAPLVAIAAYALAERVRQYGWTSERIWAGACALIGAGYALGYLAAAAARTWMRPLERTNVVLALGAMALLFVLMTPIADPARLSVADQTARLLDGRTPLAQFDFALLDFRTGRYGHEALARLQRLDGDPRRMAIAQAAKAPHEPAPYGMPSLPLNRRMTVYPAGAVLPAEFIPQKLAALRALGDGGGGVAHNMALGDATCLEMEGATCDAYILDIDGDGRPEVLISTGMAAGNGPMMIFKRDDHGHWPHVGELSVNCPASLAAMKAGHIAVQRADAHELLINGVRYRPARDTEETCATDWPKAPLADY